MKTYKKLHESKEVANTHISKIKERGGVVKQSIQDDKILLEYSFKNGIKTIVYHGSNKKFKSFDDKEKGSNMGKTPSNMAGFYFSDSKQVSMSFGKYLYTCEIRLDNPFVLDAKGKDYSQFKHKLNNISDSINKSKHDGIIVKNYKDSFEDNPTISNQYIVFNKSNIKIIDVAS